MLNNFSGQMFFKCKKCISSKNFKIPKIRTKIRRTLDIRSFYSWGLHSCGPRARNKMLPYFFWSPRKNCYFLSLTFLQKPYQNNSLISPKFCFFVIIDRNFLRKFYITVNFLSFLVEEKETIQAHQNLPISFFTAGTPAIPGTTYLK